MYFPSGHQIQFALDWSPLVTGGWMIFQIQVAAKQIEVPIDLNRLDPASQRQLDEFVNRQQNQSLTSYEAVRGAAWILDTMLQQQQPHLSKIARDAEVWKILGVQNPPSYKEPFFQAMGERFLETIQSRHEFEESTKKRHFNEVFLSWRRALYGINFGEPLPQGLRPASHALAEELEVFSCALRFTDDVARVYREYSSLIGRYAGNSIFSRWVDRIIDHRDEPMLNRLGLKYWIMCGWLHLFLWGYSNKDRLQILVRITAMYPATQQWRNVTLTPDSLKKTASRGLGLMGWSDFPETYRAPLWTPDVSPTP